MCEKEISVSHSSTESEVLSLDAGLRMDGIPAPGLWDLVIEVVHSSLDQPSTWGKLHCDDQLRKTLQRKNQEKFQPGKS